MIHTRRPISDMAWAVVACLVLVALLGWGHWVDNDAAAAEAYAAGHQAGMLEAHQVLRDAVGAAYEQGFADGHAQLQAAAEVRP